MELNFITDKAGQAWKMTTTFSEDCSRWIKDHIPSAATWNAGKEMLWNRKEWIVGGLALVIALAIIRRQMKSSTPKPVHCSNVLPASDLLNAQLIPLLSARILLEGKANSHPGALVAFCIDTSSSMKNEDRLKQVQAGTKEFVRESLKFCETAKTVFEVALVEFNRQASTIVPPTVLTQEVLKNIKSEIKKLQPHFKTRILDGLSASTDCLEQMVGKRPNSLAALVLLTDGDEEINDRDLNKIKKRWEKINVRVFAVGIGEKHLKNTLEKIANTKGGIYIDTSDKKITIQKSLKEIFEHTVEPYQNLVLKSSFLPAGSWSVGDKVSVKNAQHSECSLQDLSSGKQFLAKIQIDPKKVKEKLDLSKLVFELSYEIYGQPQRAFLNWKQTF